MTFLVRLLWLIVVVALFDALLVAFLALFTLLDRLRHRLRPRRLAPVLPLTVRPSAAEQERGLYVVRSSR